MFQSSQTKNPGSFFLQSGFFHILHIEIDDIDAQVLSNLAHSIPDVDILVHRTKTAAEALQKLSLMDFDLCISDISLHAQSNLTFIDQIARLYEDLPIILLSNMISNLVIDEGVLAGADYVLGKTELSVNSLCAAIEHTINGRGLIRERRPPTDYAFAEHHNTRLPLFSDFTQGKPNGVQVPQTEHVFTSEDLDQLRAEVALLNYELEPNLRIIAQDRRSRFRDNLYVADLVSDAIRASMQIFARKMQTCAFEGYRSSVVANCDPIDVMVILAEILRVMASETKSRGRLQVELQNLSGRTAVMIKGQAAPGSSLSYKNILDTYGDYFGPGKFAFTMDKSAAGELVMRLIFPVRLN